MAKPRTPQKVQLMVAAPQQSLVLAGFIPIPAFQRTYPLAMFPLAVGPSDCKGCWRLVVQDGKLNCVKAFSTFTLAIYQLGAFFHPEPLDPNDICLESLFSLFPE